MKAKKKGFTLVELLAAITILGIIAIIALPQVGKIATENKKKKYEKYGESLITATKLYTDSYSKDMFGNNEVGCKDITLTNLLEKGLGSDIKIDGETCDNANTFVRVSKNKDNYKYSYSMVCTKDSGATITHTYTPLGDPGLCLGIGDNTGPEIVVVPNDKLAQIVDGNKWTIGGKTDEFVEVKISDRSGLSENTKIKYGWSRSESIEPSDYTEYDFENRKNEGIKTDDPSTSTPIILQIQIPKNITGEYYLHVKPVWVYDSLQNSYQPPEDGINKPLINIDNTIPVCENNTGGIKWITSKKGENLDVDCFDGHSGCKEKTFTKKITSLKAGEKATITIEDKAGNTTDCELDVQVDTNPPTCTVSGNTSWTNQPVTLVGTCSDEESGCQTPTVSKTFSSEINAKKSPGKVCDNAGNCTDCAEKTVKIDKTAPTCTVSGGSTSWTKSNTTITAKCSDSGSGCKESSFSTTYKTEINTTTAGARGDGNGGTVEDKAGNTANCPATKTVKIDKTPPTCTVEGGSGTWINKNSSTTSRKITATCADTGGSGCEKASFSTTYSTDINTTTAGAKGNNNGGTVKDKAGNTANCAANQTVKIDKTAPTCKVEGGSTSWTKSNTTITAKCSDSGSGCKDRSFSTTYKTEINTTKAGAKGNNIGGTVEDNAGNTANCPANQTVKIDKTAPTCTVDGGNTAWINKNSSTTSRKITATCTDSGGSGCEKSSFSTTYSTDINTTTAGAKGNNNGGTVKDKAGNTTNCAANQTVRIDKTAPTCRVSGGSESWTNSNKIIEAICSDAGSGCKWTTITRGYNSNINTTKAGIMGDGKGGTITDNAGNETNCPANQTVKIDKTAPTCSVSGGSTAWVSNRTITATCTDTGGSGCKWTTLTKNYNDSIDTTTAGIYGDGNGGSVTDNAGNQASCPANQTVKIDKTKPTAPTINLSSTVETANNVTFTITAGTDSQSGVAKTEYKIGSGSWTTYSKQTTLLTNTGIQNVSARTTDNAGNVSSTTNATGYCDKDAVSVSRKDNKADGFRLNLALTYSPSGVTSKTYEYAYWEINSTSDTSNNQSSQVSSRCGNKPPSSTTIYKTTTGYTGYIEQKYQRQYYCFAVRPYRTTEITGLNRWTVQRKHAKLES